MVIHNISFPSFSTALGCSTCRPLSSLCFFILVFNTCRKADIKSLYVMWDIMNIEKADDWRGSILSVSRTGSALYFFWSLENVHWSRLKLIQCLRIISFASILGLAGGLWRPRWKVDFTQEIAFLLIQQTFYILAKSYQTFYLDQALFKFNVVHFSSSSIQGLCFVSSGTISAPDFYK